MRKRYWIAALCWCGVVGAALSQDRGIAPLNGVVTILNSKTRTGKVQYVQAATVVADKANPALTDSEGKFRLTFIDSEPGVEVRLLVEKSGLEVVNKEVLHAVLRRDADSELRIYMANPDQLAASVLKLRGIAEKQITSRYQEKITRLQKENKAQATLLLKLEDEKNAALRQFQEIAARLAAVNLDEVSGLYRQALDLFEKGRLDEAIKLIEQANLDDQLSKARNQRDLGQQMLAQSRQQIDNIAYTYLLQARMHLANLAFPKAIAAYGKAIAARDSMAFDDNLELAQVLIGQQQAWKAIPLLQRTAALSANDKPHLAYTQLMLGMAFMNQVEMQPAIEAFTASVLAYGELVEQEPLSYGPFMGVALISCATGHFFNSNGEAAAQIAQYAETIFGHLLEVDTARYLPYYSWSLYANALFNFDRGKLLQAIDGFERLDAASPGNYAAFLSVCRLLNASLMLEEAGKLESDQEEVRTLVRQSDELFESGIQEVISLLGKVQRSYPDIGFVVNGPSQLPDFAAMLNNSDYPVNILLSGVQIWWLYKGANNPDDPRRVASVLQMVVDKCRLLAGQNRERYISRQAEYTSWLGFNYCLQGEHDKAFDLLGEGLQIVEDTFIKSNPSYPFLKSLVQAELYIAHALCYVSKGELCGMDKEELALLGAAADSTLVKYDRVPMMEEILNLLRIFNRAFQETENHREFLGYYLYEENLRQFRLAGARQDEAAIRHHYYKAMESLEQFLDMRFTTTHALVLETMYNDWRTTQSGDQLDSLVKYTDKEMWLEERLLLSDCNVASSVRERLAVNCGNRAWYALQRGQYLEAAAYAQRGLQIDPSQHWIRGNEAHGYLMRGQAKKAWRIYAQWKGITFTLDASIPFEAAFLSDLEHLKTLYGPNADIEETKAMLEGRKPFPAVLTKGLEILQQATLRYEEGKLAQQQGQKQWRDKLAAAQQWILQFLQAPYLNSGYFDDDLAEIACWLTDIAVRLDKPVKPLPPETDAEAVAASARRMVEATEVVFICPDKVTLAEWELRLQVATRMMEAVVTRSPGRLDMQRTLAYCYAQQAYLLMLQGKSGALALARKSLDNYGMLQQGGVSLILALYQTGNEAETRQAMDHWGGQSWPTLKGLTCEDMVRFGLYQLKRAEGL